jgi:3',5'-cyclic AMP phosphodiesterase CpdA
MSGFRIIHISDLHFTNSAHTLNSREDKPIYIDSQNSKVRSDTIASFIIENRARFGTNKVVITGDITDSGDDADYQIAQIFVQRLKDSGFEVYAVPGNHDYCKEGNIVANTAINEGLKAIYCPLCPFLALPPPTGCCLHNIFWRLAPPGAKCPIDIFLADNASNEERRQRFINYINHYNRYPHVVDFDSGRLILLDSMQGELDEITTDIFAQGKLGDAQLSELNHFIDEYQEQRKVGKKIIVCLHHSPFDRGWKGSLKDADKFLEIMYDKIDCLLFGHTTPDDVFQQPRLQYREFDCYELNNKTPLINCENLECVSEGSAYPITVLNLGSLRRSVYWTNGSIERSWGNLS